MSLKYTHPTRDEDISPVLIPTLLVLNTPHALNNCFAEM